MEDGELRRSLETVGPLIPALNWQGEIIDGKRRVILCDELGLHLPVRFVESHQAACSFLWTQHPLRAIELAGTSTVSTLAELCGTTPTAVALELTRHRPKQKPDSRAPKHKRGEKKVLVQFWVEPQWKHAMLRAANAAHLDLSSTIRRAGVELVQRVLTNAPAVGSERGPSRDH